MGLNTSLVSAYAIDPFLIQGFTKSIDPILGDDAVCISTLKLKNHLTSQLHMIDYTSYAMQETGSNCIVYVSGQKHIWDVTTGKFYRDYSTSDLMVPFGCGNGIFRIGETLRYKDTDICTNPSIAKIKELYLIGSPDFYSFAIVFGVCDSHLYVVCLGQRILRVIENVITPRTRLYMKNDFLVVELGSTIVKKFHLSNFAMYGI